jgi:hypothetical protein
MKMKDRRHKLERELIIRERIMPLYIDGNLIAGARDSQQRVLIRLHNEQYMYVRNACHSYRTWRDDRKKLVEALRGRLAAWDAIGEDERVPDAINDTEWEEVRALLHSLGEE